MKNALIENTDFFYTILLPENSIVKKKVKNVILHTWGLLNKCKTQINQGIKAETRKKKCKVFEARRGKIEHFEDEIWKNLLPTDSPFLLPVAFCQPPRKDFQKQTLLSKP